METVLITPWLKVVMQTFVGLVVVYLSWRIFSRSKIALTRPQPDLIQSIELLLPQTQCGQCGYEGCAPYAKAITEGDAINKCPPGGKRTIRRLASLLDRETVPLDETHGKITPPTVAFIRESECIGCTKCIQACPVDAIAGAARLMHTVISAECTGCDLCIDPCPVDCIDILPAPVHNQGHWDLPSREARLEIGPQRRQIS